MNHFFGSSWLLLLLLLSSQSLLRAVVSADTCSLCETGFAAPYDPFALIVFQDEVLTCLELFQKKFDDDALSSSDCDTLHLIGATACDCRDGIPTAVNHCTLCEDGSPLPAPQQQALPGDTCASLEEDAKRDNIAACPRYQGVIGVYCQCDNPQTSRQVCSLCGTGNRLPDPTRVVSGVSCIEREFYTSLGGNCAAEKELYGGECCFTASYAPPIGSSMGSCFSEKSMVRILKRNDDATVEAVRRRGYRPKSIVADATETTTQLISISNLLIGDYVQDSDDSTFSRVYTFGHYDSKMTTDYLQIYTTNKAAAPLELSPLHMVLLRNDKFVTASTLAVGDELSGATISEIRKVTRTGAYAPFTDSGTIVVNDIVASTFVAKSSSSDTTSVVPHHWLALMSQAPHRLYSLLLHSITKQKRYTAPQEGISPWIPTSLMSWWTTTTTTYNDEQQSQSMMMLMLPPLLFLCSVAAVVEYMVRSPHQLLLLVVVVLAATVLYATTRRRQGKRV